MFSIRGTSVQDHESATLPAHPPRGSVFRLSGRSGRTATNPAARAFVWDVCKRNYYDKGVRLFWLDEAEPEYETYNYGA